jgi:hypothetical protein
MNIEKIIKKRPRLKTLSNARLLFMIASILQKERCETDHEPWPVLCSKLNAAAARKRLAVKIVPPRHISSRIGQLSA